MLWGKLLQKQEEANTQVLCRKLLALVTLIVASREGRKEARKEGR